MGPFKHIVDNGLETRKKAYDILGLILNFESFEKDDGFYKVVVQGLDDNQSVIVMKTYSLIKQIINADSKRLECHLDLILKSLRKSVFTVVKDTTVKQDLENTLTLVKSALSCLKVVQGVFADESTELIQDVQRGDLASIYIAL